jgi:hypothetical protein
MSAVRTRAVAGTGALVLLSMAGAAQSAQAENPFHCDASAIRLTVAGNGLPEPATAGRTGECSNNEALPSVDQSGLQAGALIAKTTFDAPSATGTAEGAVAHVALNPTGSPLDPGSLFAGLPSLPALPTQQAASALPPVSIGLPQSLADAVAPLGIPSSISVDLSQAALAQLPTPGELLSADLLRSDAKIGCANGAPALSGSSVITNVRLAGQDVPLDGPLTQAITVLGSQSLSPSSLDVSKIGILTPLTGATPDQVRQIQDAIASGLSSLPAISLPASVATVSLVPKEQIKTSNSLIQRALHATVTIAGQQVLDAVIGEAEVSAATADGACGTVAAQGDAALQCTDRKLALLDVIRQGRRVKLIGAANRDYVGKRVAIRLRRGDRIVAHALVRRDGSFSTTAPLPSRAIIASHTKSNTLRYRAEIGRELSLPLKLVRRLTVSSLTSKAGRVTVKGRVSGPLTTPVSSIRLVRRVSCHKVVLVKRFKPRRDGTFDVTVKAPHGASAAVYRLATYVREKPSNPRKYPTYTLPRGVALNTR